MRETDSTGAMAAAWFGTPGAAKAIDAVFPTGDDARRPGPLDAALAKYPEATTLIDAIATWMQTTRGPARAGKWLEVEQVMADLIAAAERRGSPETLAALKLFIGDNKTHTEGERIEAARAAIARATGGA